MRDPQSLTNSLAHSTVTIKKVKEKVKRSEKKGIVKPPPLLPKKR